ncbi:MAG: DUF481 domain-containing protein [Bacteroidia bacterium]
MSQLSTLAQQVINIESKRYDRLDSGWHGSSEFNLSYIQNQNKILSTGTKQDIMFIEGINTYLFINDLNFIRVNEKNLDYSTYQHLRYKRTIKPWLHGEAFGQTQFNQQLGLNFRGLLGAGPRIRLVQNDSIKVFVGPMWMYEYEVERPNKRQVVTNRLSLYISALLIKKDLLNINLLGYYQPDVANPKDFRILTELRFDFRITKYLSFRFAGSQTYDSDPPPGIPNNFLNIRNGIVYFVP